MKESPTPEYIIAKLSKNLQPLHDIEYKVGYNIEENAFLQKFIPKSFLEEDGVRVEPKNYFKSLVILDYFTNIIDGTNQVCKNLVNVSKIIRTSEREEMEATGRIKQGTKSYLSIDTVMMEIGAYSKEKGEREITKKNLAVMKNNYDNEKINLKMPELKEPDLFYHAMGSMFCDWISDERKKNIPEIQTRRDLGALIFADTIINILDEEINIKPIKEALKQKQYFEASIAAFYGLRNETTLEKLESTLTRSVDGIIDTGEKVEEIIIPTTIRPKTEFELYTEALMKEAEKRKNI